MCRFVFYLGPPITIGSLVTEPTHSLIHQSIGSRERAEPLNGDGFGVAWYADAVGGEAALFRSVTPAWNDANLGDLARIVRSRCILAHVRAATAGSEVSLVNCHPFRRGRWAFMHNGVVASFEDIRRRLLGELSDPAFRMIRGTTDSEHVFALIFDALGEAAEGRPPNVDADAAGIMAQALVRAIHRVVGLAGASAGGGRTDLNAVLTDGRSAVACRYSTHPDEAQSLYVNGGRRYTCRDGVCRLEPADSGESSVIVSSEPLSRDPGWEEVRPGRIVVMHSDGSVEMSNIQ